MTVCFVAIDAKTGDASGMNIEAVGKAKDRAAPWIAFALWVIVGLLDPSTIMLRILTRTGAFGEPWHLAALRDLALFMLPTVGLIIAVRRPQLIFGWLMLVASFAFAGGD